MAIPSTSSLLGASWSFEPPTSAPTHTIRYQHVIVCWFNTMTDLSLGALFQKDEVFGFNFNLIVSHGGQWKAHPLNKTCTPILSWAPKEITCEVNYMEVTMGLPVISSMHVGLGPHTVFSIGFGKT